MTDQDDEKSTLAHFLEIAREFLDGQTKLGNR